MFPNFSQDEERENIFDADNVLLIRKARQIKFISGNGSHMETIAKKTIEHQSDDPYALKSSDQLKENQGSPLFNPLRRIIFKLNIPRFLERISGRVLHTWNQILPFANFNPTYIRQNFITRFLSYGLADFFLHQLYWLISTISYRLQNGYLILPKKSELCQRFIAERIISHSEGSRKELALSLLNDLCKRFDEYQATKKHGDNPSTRVHRKGYLCNSVRENHTVFFEGFTQADLNSIAAFVKNSEFDACIKEYMKSNYQIYNVRFWRSLPHVKPNPLHGTHRDNLPPRAIKIMFYRGQTDANNGAFTYESVVDGSTQYFSGLNPLGLIDTNYIVHRAGTTIVENRFRDCLEIALMPSPHKDIRIVEGGFEAEHQYNPFKSSEGKPVGLKKITYFCRDSGKEIAV